MASDDRPPRKESLKSAARGRLEAMRTFGQVGTIGLSFVFAVAIGVLIGTWLDRLTGWEPWFFVIFFILGFTAGVLNVYRTISRLK
jgi:F0F1-type ATP synthase assembly protein I